METSDNALVAALEKNWRKAPISPREFALLEWTERLTLNPKSCRPEHLEPLRAVGLTDRGLLDLAQIISYFNYINRMADGLGVDLEDFMSAPKAEGMAEGDGA